MSSDADAVRAHHLEALTRRMQVAPEAVQRVLRARMEQTSARPTESAEAHAPKPTGARLKKQRSPLAELNQYIATATHQPGTARSELKSAQAFRETWSRICAEEEVVQAVQRGPENAGPLNSHMLVLRTLGLMRELSPDYLRRFMGHVDTLLWLDQANGRLKEPAGKVKAVRQKR